MEKTKFELSEFNINFDFKDTEHIDLLKKQIESGYELPIEVYEENGVYKVIDGGHAWTAYQELGREPQNVRVLMFKDNAEKIAYSRHKNINRLQQTPITYTRSIFEELRLRLRVETDEEVKKVLRRLYNLENPNKQLKENEEDVTYRNVTVGLFGKESVEWQSFVRNNLNYLDFPFWLAEMVDKQELSVSQASIINNEKLRNNEPLQKRIAEICKGKEVRWTEEFIKEVVEFEPKIETTWIFAKKSVVFGDPDYPGHCNGELVRNILYYWTEENDLVVDPMAGSGTTIDVCNLMDRKCLAYDIKPFRKDIEPWDIRNGFPKETKGCNLIFLDPPYFKKKDIDYSENSVSRLNRDDFLSFMNKLAKDCFKIVEVNGIIALLVSDFIDWSYQTNGTILTSEYWKLFRDVGFEDINRIQCPYPFTSLRNAISGHDVQKAKDNLELINTTRDLYIFRRPSK